MKYKYANSDIPWVGSFPEHWKIERIKSRTENVVGGEWGSDPDSDDSDTSKNINVIRVQDFNDIIVNLNELTVRKVKRTKIPHRLIDEGCLMIEKSGGGEKQLVGRVVHPKGITEESICSNFIAKMSFDKTVDVRFLNYVFNDLYSGNLNYPFVQQTTGIQNINIAYYLYTKFPFPPKQEQTSIALFLEDACAEIDKAIVVKLKQIDYINKHLTSKIHELITNVSDDIEVLDSNIPWIGKIPKHWKLTKLKLILDKIGSGVTPKGGSVNYQESGTAFIRSQNVLNFMLDFSDIAYISEKINSMMLNSIVYSGDVLLNITGASIGRCFYYDKAENANVNQHVCILRPSKKITTRFLHALIISEIGQSQINSGYTGSGREGLSFKSIKDFIVPLPPLKEQHEIVKSIELYIERNKAIRQNIENQIETLVQYKKSLIHEVVTGKKQVYGLT